MKFSNLVNLLLAASITASGCSAPVSQTKKQNYFPARTPVYSLPASYADSAKIEGYPDSLTLRKIAKDLGKDTFYSIDNFSVKKSLAKELNLPKRFPDGFYTEIIDNRDAPASKGNQPLEGKVKLTSTKSKQKQASWYDKPVFGINGITAKRFAIGSAVLMGFYFIADNVSKQNDKKAGKGKQDTPENKYNLPEPPADIGVGGGRIEEGSESGEVRGGRSDSDEAGGNR